MIDLEKFLSSIPFVRSFIEVREKELEEIKTGLTLASRCGMDCEKLQDRQKKTLDELERLRRKERAAVQIVELIEPPQYGEVIKAHYLDGETWEKVAEKLFFSASYLYRIRNKVFKKLQTDQAKEVQAIMQAIEEPIGEAANEASSD